MKRLVFSVMLAIVPLWFAAVCQAAVFNGTLYYTNFNGGQNVNKVSYSYDDSLAINLRLTLGPSSNIASAPGADGILFSKAGNLLIGGSTSNRVFEYTQGGSLVTSGSAGAPSFHLTLAPDGSAVYTSNFGGGLAVLPLTPNVGDTPQVYGIGGSETGVTQLAFAPNGTTFYVTGNPNGFGNVGLIDISNLNAITTTRIFTGLQPAHGMVYDDYTGLMTMFGAGAVGTFDPLQPTNALIASSLKTRQGVHSDFDQGSVDGLGHAFIAGGNALTFIDYRASGDITDPTNPTYVVGGFNAIDDLAPLSGAGSGGQQVPEPASIAVWALLGLAAVQFARIRRGRR